MGENMLFNFRALFLKMYIFEVVTLFSYLVVIQSTQFFSGSTYKIYVFHEIFFLLTIRLCTKLFRVVPCCEQLSPINMHDISTKWSCGVSCYTYLHLQMFQHHTRQSADLVQETPKHGLVPNLRSRNCLKNLCVHFHEVYN